MQIVREIITLPDSLTALRASGTIALVPTMGALHDGHLALVAEARAARRPGDRDDLRQSAAVQRPGRPRTLSAAGAMPISPSCEDAGCDLRVAARRGGLYPAGFATTVSVAGISERWEGEHRPGHFDGVATVVAKLFIATHARRRDVRRKGFPAIGGDPAADGRPRPADRDRRPPDGARSGRAGDVVAQCLAVGRTAPAGAGAARGAERGARRDRRRRSRSKQRWRRPRQDR